MLPNDDLARWGEPPTDDREMALAELLAEVLGNERAAETAPGVLPSNLSDVCRWIDEMMATVAAGAGVLENLPPPADAGGQPRSIDLRLCVSRLAAGAWRAVASTHPRPCVVRDLRRVPDSPDRVVLRNGERVRVDVICDRNGHLVVFNVGPRGSVNVLYPTRAGETGVLREREPVQILEVELTPPEGRERVYALWTASPLISQGVQLRDMKRVEQALGGMRQDDWHAVLLELEHAA